MLETFDLTLQLYQQKLQELLTPEEYEAFVKKVEEEVWDRVIQYMV